MDRKEISGTSNWHQLCPACSKSIRCWLLQLYIKKLNFLLFIQQFLKILTLPLAKIVYKYKKLSIWNMKYKLVYNNVFPFLCFTFYSLACLKCQKMYHLTYYNIQCVSIFHLFKFLFLFSTRGSDFGWWTVRNQNSWYTLWAKKHLWIMEYNAFQT